MNSGIHKLKSKTLTMILAALILLILGWFDDALIGSNTASSSGWEIPGRVIFRLSGIISRYSVNNLTIP